MYLAVIFGGKLPPKIAPKTKIAVIIVVNYYCKNGCSQRESNPQLALRRRLLYPFNYENECRIFGLFSLFGIGNHIYESNHSRDELPLFLILTSQAPLLESNSKLIPFHFQRVQPWLNLRRRTLYPAELQKHKYKAGRMILMRSALYNNLSGKKNQVLFSNKHPVETSL